MMTGPVAIARHIFIHQKQMKKTYLDQAKQDSQLAIESTQVAWMAI